MKDSVDLNSADWLCFFTKAMINKVNPNIIVDITKKKDNNGITIKRLIYIRNISEEDLLNLKFLTNTNDNNNYLYIEYFGVEIDNGKLNIPGLNEIMLNIWRHSDSYAFEKDEKFFYPFKDITNINTFIDDYTSLDKTMTKTNNKKKIYSLVLNPDCVSAVCGVSGAACGEGLTEQCCCGYYCDMNHNECAHN